MKREKSPQGLQLKGGALLMLAVSSSLVPHMAYATTAAGTVLRNSVTVAYEDNNAGTYSASASVDVTVDLVASVVWGSAPSGQTIGSGDALNSPYYVITLTNTGNGSDSYDITDNTSNTCSAGTLSAGSFGFTTPVTLGATVTAGVQNYDGGADETTIEVSNITAADFIAGDVVMIGGNPYVVASASSDGNGTTNDQLVVEGDATGDITGAGEQIGERMDYVYGATGAAGSTSSGATGCEHGHELVADGTLALGGVNNPQASATVNGWSTIIEALDLTVVKYVRNATVAAKNPVFNALTDITYNSVEYYASGVTGNPTDTLEYLVVISNDSNADATNVVFSDTLPDFTTYTASSIAVDTDGDESFDVLLPGSETEIDGSGIVAQSGQDIDVFPGVGGDEATSTGGNVSDVNTAPNNKTAIKYSVTID